MEFPHAEEPPISPGARDTPETPIDDAAPPHPTYETEAGAALAPPPDEITGENTKLTSVEPPNGANGEAAPEKPAHTPGAAPEPPEPEQTPRDASDKPPIEPPVAPTPAGTGDGEHRPAMVNHTNESGTVVLSTFTRAIAGTPRAGLFAYDAAGTPLKIPGIGHEIPLEGSERSGLTYSTTEHDEAGRPVKILGQGIDQSQGPTLREIMAGVGGDGTITSEMTLGYNDEGLLETVTEVGQRAGTIAKKIHTNYFQDGELVGFTRQELTDINPATGQETFTTKLLVVYEQADESWQETAYQGYRDGLIPSRVTTGTLMGEERPFSTPVDQTYDRIAYPPHQLPYAITAEPDYARLVTTNQDGTPSENHVVMLPSWIPQTAATDVASGRQPLHEAAQRPNFPEAQNTEIISRWTAFNRIGAHHDLNRYGDDEVCDLMNELSLRRVVVLQPEHPEPPLTAMMNFRTSPAGVELSGPITDAQKLGLLAALHPVFSRPEIIAPSAARRALDQRNLAALLKTLNTTGHHILNTVSTLGDGLNKDVRARIRYLFP